MPLLHEMHHSSIETVLVLRCMRLPASQIKYIRVAEDVRASSIYPTCGRSREDTLNEANASVTIRSSTLLKQRNKRRGNGEKVNHIEEGEQTAVEVVEEVSLNYQTHATHGSNLADCMYSAVVTGDRGGRGGRGEELRQHAYRHNELS
jgi:hypothetical protein